MKLVRCKACGYVMPEAQLGDKCPACGVPRNMLQPYTDPVAEPRRRVLKFHLHPIAVHFPTTLAVAVLVFSLAAFPFAGEAEALLESTTKVLGAVLPAVVLLAGLLGVLDGRVRYRKIRNSEVLKRKLAYAAGLFVISLAIGLAVWLDQVWARVATVVLAGGAVVCSIFLGLLGMGLDDSALPGR